eukprot:6197435-Pleurochrysis_carterae.AAC.5
MCKTLKTKKAPTGRQLGPITRHVPHFVDFFSFTSGRGPKASCGAARRDGATAWRTAVRTPTLAHLLARVTLERSGYRIKCHILTKRR